MTLSLEFCEEVMGCDQARTPKNCFTTCNLTGQIVYGMGFNACPKIQQLLAKARTEGRQQAAAELDRTAGQPVQTYVEKQSLVNLLILTGCKYHEEKKDDHAAAINLILTAALTGTVLKEVEL